MSLTTTRRNAKRNRLASANPEGWTIHTPYHWSRILKGKKLDWWPSTGRFQYNSGDVQEGDVMEFIRRGMEEL